MLENLLLRNKFTFRVMETLAESITNLPRRPRPSPNLWLKKLHSSCSGTSKQLKTEDDGTLPGGQRIHCSTGTLANGEAGVEVRG